MAQLALIYFVLGPAYASTRSIKGDHMQFSTLLRLSLALIFVCGAAVAQAEDGHDLWLRYRSLNTPLLSLYRPALKTLVITGGSSTLDAARDVLVHGLGGLLGLPVITAREIGDDGAVVVGTPTSSRIVAGLDLPLAQAGDEGYVLRSMRWGGTRLRSLLQGATSGCCMACSVFYDCCKPGSPSIIWTSLRCRAHYGPHPWYDGATRADWGDIYATVRA
jgi:hypothetical protein